MSKASTDDHHPRRSACAEAALRAEIKRVSRMTVEERIIASLTMRERFSWIRPEENLHCGGEK